MIHHKPWQLYQKEDQCLNFLVTYWKHAGTTTKKMFKGFEMRASRSGARVSEAWEEEEDGDDVDEEDGDVV